MIELQSTLDLFVFLCYFDDICCFLLLISLVFIRRIIFRQFAHVWSMSILLLLPQFIHFGNVAAMLLSPYFFKLIYL